MSDIKPNIKGNVAETVYESLERDDYGRPVRHYYSTYQWGRTKVVAVTLPKCAWERNGGLKYLVNNWQIADIWEGGRCVNRDEQITYVRTLKEARALAVSLIAE